MLGLDELFQFKTVFFVCKEVCCVIGSAVTNHPHHGERQKEESLQEKQPKDYVDPGAALPVRFAGIDGGAIGARRGRSDGAAITIFARVPIEIAARCKVRKPRPQGSEAGDNERQTEANPA